MWPTPTAALTLFADAEGGKDAGEDVVGGGETGKGVECGKRGVQVEKGLPMEVNDAILARALERLPADTPSGDVFVHFAVSDAETTDVGPRLKEATLEVDGTPTRARFVGGDLFRAKVHIGDGPVSYRACATDAAGNHACGDAVMFTPRRSRSALIVISALALGVLLGVAFARRRLV